MTNGAGNGRSVERRDRRATSGRRKKRKSAKKRGSNKRLVGGSF